MSAIAAAATLGEMSGWSLSNLQLQKLLYIAQMFHLGETGEPIFCDDFEAWKLGPVVPSVYQSAKIFGSKPVTSFFTKGRLPDGSGRKMLERVLKELPNKSPWKLVSITHWDGGAWAKHYHEGANGSVIPQGDILAEYRARVSKRHARKAQSN
jgi:uncharacterized phage-associated protein